MQQDTFEYLKRRIDEHMKLLNLSKDTFLRKCLVCYVTWRPRDIQVIELKSEDKLLDVIHSFHCPTPGCTQHAWNIDYNDHDAEQK